MREAEERRRTEERQPYRATVHKSADHGRQKLLPAFQIDYKDKFTDEATVVEAYGMKVSLVEGEENNIKITRPADMQVAEKYLGV